MKSRRKAVLVNELVLRSEAGKEICTLRFDDQEWDRLLTAAISYFVNTALAQYLAAHEKGDSK